MFGLTQVIDQPTRSTPTSSSILDHILCNQKDKVYQSGTISLGLSDHCMVFCTRKSVRSKIYESNCVCIRSMKNYTKECFVEKLSQINWLETIKSENVNDTCMV